MLMNTNEDSKQTQYTYKQAITQRQATGNNKEHSNEFQIAH